MSNVLFNGLTLTVEVGFSTSAGPNTIPNLTTPLSAIVWTDITEYVREVETSRGRSSELDDYSAGSCSLTLDNRTRRFDPEHAAGPYYGTLTPLRPIRIRVTPSGGTIRSIFFGYVDQWPQAYEYPTDATVTVTASDGFKILNMITYPSLWAETVEYYAPYRWWRMADPAGSFYLYDSANSTTTSAQWMSSTGAGVQSTNVSGPSLVVGESVTSSSFDGTRFVQAYDPLGINNITPMLSAWTVQMWIQTTETTTGNYAIWNHGDFIHGGSIGMVVAAGNATIVAQFGNRGVSNTMVTKNVQITVNDGQPHHIMMCYRSDPSLGTVQELYVDGEQTGVVTGGFTDIVTQGYYYMTLGSPSLKSLTASNNFTNYFRGSIQEVTVYGDALTAFDNLVLYKTGFGTYQEGNFTDSRITALLTKAKWPTDGADLALGQSSVLGLMTTGNNALSMLKEVETAEQGRLFMSVDGKVKFVARNGLGTGNYVVVQGQFDDLAFTNPSHGISYSDITLTYDDRYIFNDVTTKQPNGASYRAQDTTSQNQYFLRASTIDNLIVDDGYLLSNTAISRLSQYKQPQMRIDSLTVNGRAETSKQTILVGLDIGDRVTVVRTPATGSAITKALIIEGIKHVITPESWEVTFNTSSTNNSPFVLDSALLGVLDTNILGY